MSREQKILPFFPLSVFLLPGEDIPLRIFEPKYIQLIEESRDPDFTFVIPFLIDDQVQDYGCEVKLQQVVAENPNGKMVVTIEGVSLVRIESFTKNLEGKLYSGGIIEQLPPAGKVFDEELLRLVDKYRDEFKNSILDSIPSYEISYHDILVALNLPSEEKYKFILMADSRQKIKYLVKQMEYLLLIRNQEQKLGNEFGLN